MPLYSHRITDLSPLVRVYRCGETKKESIEQINFISWLRVNHPVLYRDVFHVPNEGKHTGSYRAMQAKMGLKKGIPDLLFWCHSLVIEMKAHKGSIEAEQKLRLNQAAEAGQFVAVCYGAEAAKEAIADYLEWRK